MYLQLQSEDAKLLALRPLLDESPVRLLIDHCGRPVVARGMQQPAFQMVLDLGRSVRATVKLSGYIKFSDVPFPPIRMPNLCTRIGRRVHTGALNVKLRLDLPESAKRIDCGPLFKKVETLFPQHANRAQLFRKTPRRLFGFD